LPLAPSRRRPPDRPPGRSDQRRPKRARPPALIVLPAEYVPLDPDHERQAIDALTELFLQLLARDEAEDAES